MIRLLNTLSEFRGWTIAERGFLVRARMFCARKKHLECGSIDSESSFFYHKVSRDLKSRWNPSIYFWISHISEHTALHNFSHDRGCFNRIWSPNGVFKHQNNSGIEFFLSQSTHRLHISLESVYLILVFSH